MVRALVILVLLVAAQHAARAATLEQACAASGNDDTIHRYDASLHAGALAAFRALFPGAPPPSVSRLAAQGRFRCMGGHVYACFIGANLPCQKIATGQANPGAEAFCRDNPQADVVPMVATGHDTRYAYRCQTGRAVVTGTLFRLDARGFAQSIWAPAD